MSSLNTPLPNLYNFITQCSPEPAIITFQETKFSAIKSIKYLQKKFPQYKLMFNITHSPTTCMHHQNLPYTPMQGGLLIFIHNTYSFANNVTKIPTPACMSLYLQIINILNQPLKPWLIINIYMPSHNKDLALIPKIQTNITHQLTSHPNHNITRLGDFNRDIALIGRHHNYTHVPPTPPDLYQQNFLTNLQLTYIPTTTTYSRQGGKNYTHTSLIDGFFLKIDNLLLRGSHLANLSAQNTDLNKSPTTTLLKTNRTLLIPTDQAHL